MVLALNSDFAEKKASQYQYHCLSGCLHFLSLANLQCARLLTDSAEQISRQRKLVLHYITFVIGSKYNLPHVFIQPDEKTQNQLRRLTPLYLLCAVYNSCALYNHWSVNTVPYCHPSS